MRLTEAQIIEREMGTVPTVSFTRREQGREVAMLQDTTAILAKVRVVKYATCWSCCKRVRATVGVTLFRHKLVPIGGRWQTIVCPGSGTTEPHEGATRSMHGKPKIWYWRQRWRTW